MNKSFPRFSHMCRFVTFAKSLDFSSVLGYNNIKSQFSKSELDIERGAFDVYRQRNGTEILK